MTIVISDYLYSQKLGVRVYTKRVDRKAKEDSLKRTLSPRHEYSILYIEEWMAGTICRLYESPQEGELCMKR